MGCADLLALQCFASDEKRFRWVLTGVLQFRKMEEGERQEDVGERRQNEVCRIRREGD